MGGCAVDEGRNRGFGVEEGALGNVANDEQRVWWWCQEERWTTGWSRCQSRVSRLPNPEAGSDAAGPVKAAFVSRRLPLSSAVQ